jgi:hypothetical protein
MRLRALVLWLACTAVLPLLWIMQLLQAIAGNPERSINMAAAIDSCGNALFGGEPDMTLSERVGLARMSGKRYSRVAVTVIDALFGKGHCAAEAQEWLTRRQIRTVDRDAAA